MNTCRIREQYEVVIIGAGAAGISAAKAAYEEGCRQILLIDCREQLGGVLPQCTHRGFGIQQTGPEYIQTLLQGFPKEVDVLLKTTVLSVSKKKTLIISGTDTGFMQIAFEQLILAAGCLEIPMGCLPIGGTRPAGIYTAGQVQEMINLYGELPEEPAVILGSGDLGLILAAQLAEKGIEVKAIIEKKASCTAMARNRERIQNHPVMLCFSSTITEVYGEKTLYAVKVKQLQTGQTELLPCKSLLIAAGLRPDRSLLQEFEEENLPTWIQICGNCKEVHPMIEAVIKEGRWAGQHAAKGIQEKKEK